MSATVIELENNNVVDLSPRERKLQEWQLSVEYIKRDSIEEGDEDLVYFSELLLATIKSKRSTKT